MKALKLLFIFVAFINTGVVSSQTQTTVSTVKSKRNAVIFDFTGIHCVSCPKAHTAIAVAKSHYPGTVALAFHTGSFAVPNPGEPDFRTVEGDSLLNNFAFFSPVDNIYRVVWSYPTVCINNFEVKTNNVYDTVAFLEKISSVAIQDAVVNIAATATVDTVHRKLKVQTECFFTGNPPGSCYLAISVTQNGLIAPQAGGGDNYVHNDMFRMFVSSLWGDSLGWPAQGELITKTYLIDLPDSIRYQNSSAVELNIHNISVQAYISSNDTIVTAYDFFNNPYFDRHSFEVLNGVNADMEFANLNLIAENAQSPGLIVFPNPVDDKINIALPSSLQHYDRFQIEIIDFKGMVLKRKNLRFDGENIVTLSTTNLNKGFYIVKVKNENTFAVSKFIKL